MSLKINLKQLEGVYAIAQMSHLDSIPDWVDGEGFVNISRTDDELSLVCLGNRIPPDVNVDSGWICFKFLGPFAFDAAGVILTVIRPLSENGIGVFVVSTFNGDILLLKSEDVDFAKTLLLDAGHTLGY
jgi:hypothetical protein